MKGVVTATKRRGVGEPDLLAAFCEYLRVERGLARLSIESYAGDLKKWMAFLAERKRGSLAVGTSLRAQAAQTASSSEMGDKQEGEPHCYSLERPRRRVSGNLLAPQPAQPQRASGNLLAQARREDVRAFLERLFADGAEGRTVARKLSALRQCYRFLLLDRHIKHDPTLDIDSPRQWKVLPKSLGKAEVESLLEDTDITAPKAKCAHELKLRNRAMLEALYAGGLRASEVVGLRMEDVKLDLGYVLVRGKGDKERIVPLGQAALTAISEYLAVRGALAGGEAVGVAVYWARGAAADAGACVADRVGELGADGAACVSAHAEAQRGDPHGGKRRGPAHGANDAGTCGHFDDAGLYASGDGQAEECVPGVSSAGEAAGRGVTRLSHICHGGRAWGTGDYALTRVSGLPEFALDYNATPMANRRYLRGSRNSYRKYWTFKSVVQSKT